MDTGPGTPPDRPGTPPDRRVVLVIALLVVVVLALNLASAILPGVDGALASLPLVVLALVLGTALVLLRALRHG